MLKKQWSLQTWLEEFGKLEDSLEPTELDEESNFCGTRLSGHHLGICSENGWEKSHKDIMPNGYFIVISHSRK